MPRTLKILFYSPTVGRGGIHTVAENLIRGLAEAGRGYFAFSILGQQYDENGTKVQWPGHVAFEQIGPVDRLPPHPYQMRWLKEHSGDFLAHLRRKIDEFKPDVVYCLSPWWTMGEDEDWPLGSIPFVTMLPDLAFDVLDNSSHSKHFREAAHRIAARSACTVFPSDHWRNHAIQKYGFTLEKTEVIHHSMDFTALNYEPTPGEAKRVRLKYNLPDRYMLAFHCFGHKDPATILRGQHYARSHSPAIPPLVMAGIETERYLQPPEDQHVRDIQRVIKSIHATLGNDLIILGTLPDQDVAGLHAGATAALFATRMEGDISGPMFNAIAAHCPIIYTDLSVFRDRLGRTQGYGLTFPVGNSVLLGQKIMHTCEHKRESEIRSDAAYDLLSRRTVIHVARSYLDVFRRVAHVRIRTGRLKVGDAPYDV